MHKGQDFIKRKLQYEGPVNSGFLEDYIIWNIADILMYGATLERRARVEFLPKIGMIQVYVDHDPPHSHIQIKDSTDLKFHLNTCQQIEGKPISSKQKKDLLRWYFDEYGFSKVATLWNQLNPGREIDTTPMR